MALTYRAGFMRDRTGTVENYVAGSTPGTGLIKHGFLRRTDDSSDALLITSSTAGASFRCGFCHAPGAGGEPGLGALCAVQEPDLTAPVITTYWRGGFLREVSTNRLVWVLPGTPGLVATMQRGFLRSARGDLVLD